MELAKTYKASCESANTVLAAMDFLSTEGRKEVRKDNLSKRYMIEKQVRFLTSGGHSKVLATHLSQFLQSSEGGAAFEQAMAKNTSADFNDGMVNIYGKAEAEQEGTWPHFMGWWRDSLGEHLTAKTADMAARMTKKGWKSSMSKFDNITTEEVVGRYPFGDAGEMSVDPGAAAWVVGLKANAFRVGPENTTMPGLPLFILALDQPLCIVCYKVDELLSQGIALNDLGGYLDSPSAAAYLTEHCFVAKIITGEVLFVPIGYVPTVTFVAASREQENTTPFAFYLSYTMWSTSSVSSLGANVWNAIAGYNTKYLESVATSRPFVTRVALMQRFTKEVADAPKETT